MQTTTTRGVKCGNVKVHGREQATYHATIAAVKACYAARYANGQFTGGISDSRSRAGIGGVADALVYGGNGVTTDDLPDMGTDTPDEDARSEREARRADFSISHVPEGRYAVEDPKSGELRFVAISKGAEDGRWKDHTFAEVLSAGQHSLNAHKLGSNRPNGAKYYGKAHGMMRVLASMTDKEWNAARIRFGIELKYCGFHPGPLTNDKSRRLGYGEQCARNNGLPY